MQFWLCRNRHGDYLLTNYCPYRGNDDNADLWFYYPSWLWGKSFIKSISMFEVEALGGEIPALSCKNLVTGQIVKHEDLLPASGYDEKKYYPWGV